MLRTGLDAVRLRFRLQVWGLLSLLRVRGGGGGGGGWILKKLDFSVVLLCFWAIFL